MTFPAHKCGLYLTHNENRDLHESLDYWLSQGSGTHVSSHLSDADRAECMRTDNIWVLQWYPETPVSFYLVAGPTLERVLELASQ